MGTALRQMLMVAGLVLSRLEFISVQDYKRSTCLLFCLYGDSHPARGLSIRLGVHTVTSLFEVFPLK